MNEEKQKNTEWSKKAHKLRIAIAERLESSGEKEK